MFQLTRNGFVLIHLEQSRYVSGKQEAMVRIRKAGVPS